ncbi:hypothetical protein FB382_001979 [Nocardioides ginsengisegetis]|uniref:Uncharacterized protein n=1 Tax=Nocardioides ginsengisegetis TaxID=661491 RepID=A0A7W3IZW9_9ACTN|nr:hypothetical protein [Nocardioides ginsengisegetis]MBA8803688.1 hypothetical protein [Nocardioides ginsengisegetis]
MRRFVPVVALAVLATLPGTTSAGAQPADLAKANTYRTWTACDEHPDSKHSSSCPKEGVKGLFFKSVDAHVTYKVCVIFPQGKKLCASHQDAPKGKVAINTITSNKIGVHTINWFVGGNKVATRHLTIHN